MRKLELLERAKRGELENDRLSVRIHTHAESSLVRGDRERRSRGLAAWTRHPYRLRELAGAPGRRTKDQRVQQLRELAVAAGVPDPDVK